MEVIYKNVGSSLVTGQDAELLIKKSISDAQSKLSKLNIIRTYINMKHLSFYDFKVSDEFDLISKNEVELNNWEVVVRYTGLYLRCFKNEKIYLHTFDCIKIYGDPFDIYLGDYSLENEHDDYKFRLRKDWAEGCAFNPILLKAIQQKIEAAGDTFLVEEYDKFMRNFNSTE